jgi:intracellular septation protein A
MKALLDYLPIIIFFYFYKTTDPKDSHHPHYSWLVAQEIPIKIIFLLQPVRFNFNACCLRLFVLFPEI